MTVKELRDLLATYPDDMPVLMADAIDAGEAQEVYLTEQQGAIPMAKGAWEFTRHGGQDVLALFPN